MQFVAMHHVNTHQPYRRLGFIHKRHRYYSRVFYYVGNCSMYDVYVVVEIIGIEFKNECDSSGLSCGASGTHIVATNSTHRQILPDIILHAFRHTTALFTNPSAFAQHHHPLAPQPIPSPPPQIKLYTQHASRGVPGPYRLRWRGRLPWRHPRRRPPRAALHHDLPLRRLRRPRLPRQGCRRRVPALRGPRALQGAHQAVRGPRFACAWARAAQFWLTSYTVWSSSRRDRFRWDYLDMHRKVVKGDLLDDMRRSGVWNRKHSYGAWSLGL